MVCVFPVYSTPITLSGPSFYLGCMHLKLELSVVSHSLMVNWILQSRTA